MIFQPNQILVRDQQTIDIIFSSMPSLLLTKANFYIQSTFTGVPNLGILSISIDDYTITLNIRPMFAQNLYLIELLDVQSQAFVDVNSIELSNLDNARQIYFVGVEDINTVRDTMLQNLPSVYDTSSETLVRDITTMLAAEINTAAITLNEVNNDNFISIDVVDELYYRGSGPADRLQNENAYKVSRVAKTVTGTQFAGLKTFDPTTDPNIPFEVINLRVLQVIETVPNGLSTNEFSGYLITVSHQFVTKLLSVELNPGDLTYDPTLYGYALLNNNYDRYARPSPILQNNQISLSPLTNGAFSEPIPGDTLTVTYEFDNVGRRVDGTTISLYTIQEQIDEIVPESVSSFFLEFSNIVNSAGQVVVIAAINFYVSSINLSKHPAFLREFAYNSDSLPSAPGEYAINYTTGQVFVYGTANQLGTGKMPPVATYFYKNIAVSNTDYFISDDGYNITLNSFSQFATQKFSIAYLYEDIFTPGVDYDVSSHIEALNERINNRLVSAFVVKASNSPVKDVYQVLNETTGESYTPGLIDGDDIYFTGNVAPATSTTLGELAQVGVVSSESLNVGIATTTLNGLLRVFPIALAQHPVMNQRLDGIGSNFSTSVLFSLTDLFLNELYFEPSDTIQINLGSFRNIGDYSIDYAGGVIYVAVSSLQDFNMGDVSYAYGSFIPDFTHVLGVTSIGIGSTSTNLVLDFDVANIEDGLIVPANLNYGYDAFDGITRVPNSNSVFVAQLQPDFTIYTKYPIKKIYGVYTQNDVDAYGSSVLPTKNLFNPAINSFNNTLIDLKTYLILTVETLSSTYYEVIIPDNVAVVSSIVVVDTGVQLLDTRLLVIKYADIIIKSVNAISGTATVTLQNVITLNTNDVALTSPQGDFLVDIAGNSFKITSITGASTPPNTTGNVITVTYSGMAPVVNSGSEILDQNGILVAAFLNIISVTELPDLLYVIHYDVFPAGILVGYQVQDYNGNIFTITAVQTSSVVVSVPGSTIPVVDPVAKIETTAILQPPSSGSTILQLPLDAPITVGTSLQIGYISQAINNSIIAANTATLSAGGAGMLIDYSIGQYFLNYNHLDDELLVSYDWGDNQLDWSISDILSQGDPYYVSYSYGASRNALQTNFGALTHVDFLQNLSLDISRETYRTAIGATIKAFLKGPTHEAIRLLVHAFTQIDPQIDEAILYQWILGRNPLNLQAPINTGSIVFGNGKYGEGLLMTDNDSVQLPGASSIRLAQGTFSTWFRPNWNGNQADEEIIFSSPSDVFSVYYNAHDVLPQEVRKHSWQLSIDSDSYGTAYVNNDYLEVRNSKNEYTTLDTPGNYDYLMNDSDGYSISSTSMIHDGFTLFPYARIIGNYVWKRDEQILSAANDLDINFSGYVYEMNYVNPLASVVKVANVVIDDGYSAYDAGFYLLKRNLYSSEIMLEDVHLSIAPPYPHSSPPIVVSTILGTDTANVISGDTSTLSIGQHITISSAYPTLTNILGFTSTHIILRGNALATLSSVSIGNLDPLSHPGMQDGYGEIYLEDGLGTRPLGTTIERTNGWDRQLLIEIELSPYSLGYLMSLGSDYEPLTTQTPVSDFINSITPGIDVLVDGYGNVFEIDHIALPYAWLKKPSASGAAEPEGTLTAFRKTIGVDFPDATLTSIPANWSEPSSYLFEKRDGTITITTNQTNISNSYVLHYDHNTSGTSGISFGQIDYNVDAVVRIQSVNYNIYSVFETSDVYIGNTGNNPTTTSIAFDYNTATTGIPAISVDKYFAIFTSLSSANTNEPADQVFVKMKLPSAWALSDGTNTEIFAITPTIKFFAQTDGDIIDIVDAYGMSYEAGKSGIELTAIDTSTYVSGHNSILLDSGPELRISVGARHYFLDVETPEGALRLYRHGSGFLTAETQLKNSLLYNIRGDISSWVAGQLHYIAMSWKISSPDETDELHLFIDGDEVPNEVSFGSGQVDGYIGQVYEEKLTPVLRIASSGGYIVNDVNGSGVFIPFAASIQPNNTWINRTLVINSISLGPNTYLNEPLIVGAVVEVSGGNMVFVSQNNTQINFSMYGPSTPILYGLATYTTAITTILVSANFGIFDNGTEFDGPASTNPQFRQVGDTQIVELYNTDPDTGEYVENVLSTDTITVRTYGLLTQSVKSSIYQYGSLIRNTPLIVDTVQSNTLIMNDIVLNSPAFITSLPAPVDATQVTAVKILLPRVAI